MDDNEPPDSSVNTTASKSRDFHLGMDLTYRDGKGKIAALVCKGASAYILKHTICLEDGSKLQIHNSNLQLIYQPDFSNLPKTPLDHSNEVGTCLILVEAQSLAHPLLHLRYSRI